MFTLNNYVDALFDAISHSPGKEGRKKIMASWFRMLKRHHRHLEGEKILEVIEKEIKESQKRVQISVSDEAGKKILGEFFCSKKLSPKWNIDPQVLGGARILKNNVLIDNTLENQINKLEKNLTK